MTTAVGCLSLLRCAYVIAWPLVAIYDPTIFVFRSDCVLDRCYNVAYDSRLVDPPPPSQPPPPPPSPSPPNTSNRATPQGSPERVLFEQKQVQEFVAWLEDSESSSEEDDDDESTEEED